MSARSRPPSAPGAGYEAVAAYLIGVLFAVGTLAHLWPPTLGLMLRLSPGFLLLCAIAVLVPALRALRLPFLVWAILAWALTFALEALGVATGLVFGAYRYGQVLGPRFLGVPLLVALNWVLVVHGAWALSRGLLGGSWGAILLSSLVATGFDWIMEPAAIALGYWTWEGGAVPPRNYMAWFMIAFAAALGRRVMEAGRLRPPGRAAAPGERLARAYLLIQAAFFALLRLGWACFPAR